MKHVNHRQNLYYRQINYRENTPSYKLAKYPILTPLKFSDYTIKNSFSFAEEVCSFHYAHYMTMFDIESLFTNIPLEETINICVDKPFENNTKVNNLNKESCRSLLELATLHSFFFFIFYGKCYKQKDGVVMGSSLGLTLANVFLCHFKEQWMSDCPIYYKLFSYRSYVGDTFLLFLSKLRVTRFLNYMNSKHRNIKFTVEPEENNSLSFINIKRFCDSRKSQTLVYRKPTFSLTFTNFEIFLPISYKYDLVSILLHRRCMICSFYKTLHFETLKLKKFFEVTGTLKISLIVA